MKEHLDRFYIPEVSRGGRIEVGKDEARHIARVLRMQVGDELTAFDGSGIECVCRIADIAGKRVVLEVIERRKIDREPGVHVMLAVAAAKTKAMDLVIQKCTELGVARVVPFHSKRSVARIEDRGKSEKWQRTVIEAAKQCGRNVLPEVVEPVAFEKLTEEIAAHDLAVVAAVAEKSVTLKHALEQHPQAGRILYLIGPEGGFTPEELAELQQMNAQPVSLGKSILRVETAAIAMLAMILYHYSL